MMNILTVLDVKTGQPIEGATVSIDGNPSGKTDATGVFTVPVQGGMIKITHISYEPEQFDIAGGINQVIRMIPKSGDLPEVIITAIKKKENVFFIIMIIIVIALLFYYRKQIFK